MITLIAALANNRVIGVNGTIPFDEQADRRQFAIATRGHVVVMGRVTFESIGKPLPNRTNMVLTNNRSWTAEGVLVERSFSECLASVLYLSKHQDVMIIGGEKVYKLFMPYAKQMILTHVDADVKGDTYFPQFHYQDWDAKVVMHHGADDKNQYPFVVRMYTKKL